MSRLFLWVSLFFSKAAPIAVILKNHLRHDEGGWNVQVVGMILIFIIVYFAIIKPMNERVRVWDIQGENEYLVVNYRLFRTILIVGLVWWMWVVLHQDYEIVYNTIQLIFTSLVLGLVFRNLSLTFEKEE